jgi:hypothetical protein
MHQGDLRQLRQFIAQSDRPLATANVESLASNPPKSA